MKSSSSLSDLDWISARRSILPRIGSSIEPEFIAAIEYRWRGGVQAPPHCWSAALESAQSLNRNRFLSSEQDSVVQFQDEKAVFFGGASNGDEAGAAAGKPSDYGIGGAATLLSRHRTFGREGGSAQAGSRRQVQTILWVRACHSATVLTLPTPRTRNLVSPRLRAWALAHSAVAARSL